VGSERLVLVFFDYPPEKILYDIAVGAERRRDFIILNNPVLSLSLSITTNSILTNKEK